MRGQVPADFALPQAGRWRGWIVAVALAGLVLVASTVVFWEARQQEQRSQADWQATQATPQAGPAAASAPSAPYKTSADALLAERELDWPDVLSALEGTQVVGVRLQAVDMQSADRAVRIELEADSYAGLRQYQAQLNAGLDTPRWRWLGAQARLQASGGSEARYSAQLETRLQPYGAR